MTSSSSESNDYFLHQLFRSVQHSSNYIRIEPSNLSSIEPALDAASPGNIQKIVSLADKLISDNENMLDAYVLDLIAEKEKNGEKKHNSVWKFLREKL